MNILQQSQQQSQPTPQRHLYSIKQLATLAIASVVSILLLFGNHVFSLGSISEILAIIGCTIYLLVIATILIVDWRGFLTMNGFLKWKAMTGKQRLIVGGLFAALNIFVLGSYLVQAYLTYRLHKRQEPLRRKRKIAEQEAELGMVPRTEGTCHNCHQPLQLGAEFCVYCGEKVMDRPRICPECYTTTLPDARWCPVCGTQLDRTALPELK